MEPKYAKHFVLIGVIMVATLCILRLQYGQYIIIRKFQNRSSAPYPFRAITTMNGVYVFANVCIEALDSPKLQNTNRELFNETKKIVIYGQQNQSNGIVNVGVAGSLNSLWNHWQLHFNNKTLPKEFPYHSDTAFFVQPTCPGNFHHFFEDEFLALYSAVSLSNRLHPGSNNQIIYRTPQVERNGCTDRSTYEVFLQTLYIKKVHDVFYNLPDNACFRDAIFGCKPLLARHRDVVDHVLRFYEFPVLDIRNTSGLFVTILSRSVRRIVNIEELASFAREVGFQNVRIVDFGRISVHEQLRIMSTTKVFVGVQGAGLQWSIFMPERSFLIELAWPQKHWIFYYHKFVSRFGVVWKGVGVDDVRLNWTSYERNVRRGIPVKEAEKIKLVEIHPINAADNIWKWSDVYVQKKEILSTLEAVHKSLHSNNIT